MSNIEKPYRYPSNDPYKGIEVQKIEKESHEKKWGNSPKPPKKSSLKIFFAKMVKNIAQIFKKSSENASKLDLDQFLFSTVEELKKAFQTLQEKEGKEDKEFLTSLPFLWKEFNEKGKRFIKNPSLHEKITTFSRSIFSYPKPYSLGDYLEGFIKNPEISSPYIELVEKLHLEHKNDPLSSHLTLWVNQLIAIQKEKSLK